MEKFLQLKLDWKNFREILGGCVNGRETSKFRIRISETRVTPRPQLTKKCKKSAVLTQLNGIQVARDVGIPVKLVDDGLSQRLRCRWFTVGQVGMLWCRLQGP
jgi:hypothetical protein